METRLQILHDAQVIDKDVYHGMLAVIARLEQHWNLRIRQAQGEMMITHMANAMMRARQGDIIPAIDAEILAEITRSDFYANIQEMHHDLLSLFAFTVPEYEQGYLLANLYGLVLAQQESAA
jgi:hypothetical protein